MNRLMEMAEEKVQQRSITITTYKAGHGKALIVGRLVDRRFHEIYLIDGEKRPVGIVHDMIIRLLIDTTTFTIEDLEVEFLEVPRTECSEIQNSLSVIKGMRISKGFTNRMKSLLGGSLSCTHLRELLEAMAPAVFQGVFTILAEDDLHLRLLMNDPQMSRHFRDTIADTCYVWRSDGPELKKVLDLLENMT